MLSPIPVAVTYRTNDKVFNTDFEIYAILLESIKIVREPDKTEYRYGELLNHSGLIVHAVYNNEEEEDITGQGGGSKELPHCYYRDILTHS